MPPGSVQQPTENTNACRTEPSVSQTYGGKGCVSLDLLLGIVLASPKHFQNMGHTCLKITWVNSPPSHHVALEQACAVTPGRGPVLQDCGPSQVDLALAEINSLLPRHSSAFIQSLWTDLFSLPFTSLTAASHPTASLSARSFLPWGPLLLAQFPIPGALFLLFLLPLCHTASSLGHASQQLRGSSS